MRRKQRRPQTPGSCHSRTAVRHSRSVLGLGQRAAGGVSAATQVGASRCMSNSIRILHLEDDPADARLIEEQLNKSGLRMSLMLVNTREQFEAALAIGEVDIVLSDYHMPRFNGLEALEMVRERTPEMPFILVTGALGDERAVALLRSGATDF